MDIILPAPAEGYEYVLQPKKRELIVQLREERDRLKVELDAMVVPSNEELKEMGKMMHPYYQKERQLDMVKYRINALK